MSTLTTVNSAGINELGIQIPVENRFEYSMSQSINGKNAKTTVCILKRDPSTRDALDSSSIGMLTTFAVFALLLLLILTAMWTVYQVCSVWCSTGLLDFLNHVAGFRFYAT